MSNNKIGATFGGGGWDAVVIAELRRVYWEAASDVIRARSLDAAHNEGLRAVAEHVAAQERATMTPPRSAARHE